MHSTHHNVSSPPPTHTNHTKTSADRQTWLLGGPGGEQIPLFFLLLMFSTGTCGSHHHHQQQQQHHHHHTAPHLFRLTCQQTSPPTTNHQVIMRSVASRCVEARGTYRSPNATNHTHTRARTHAHAHAHTHTRARARRNAGRQPTGADSRLLLTAQCTRARTHARTHVRTHVVGR